MALTAGHDIYAALHETGINKFIHMVYVSRRYLFHLATLGFGPGAPGIDYTVLPPLPVPGTSYGLAYSVEIAQPIIDFPPQDAGLGLPAPLNLTIDHFSLFFKLTICVLWGSQIPIPDPFPQGREHGHKPPSSGRGGGQKPERVCTDLKVWAVGHPTVVPIGPIDRLIGLEVDDIIVKEVCDLEKVLECLAKDTVNALLEQVQVTVKRIALGALPFGLALAAGPSINDDQLKIWASIVP